MMMTKDLDGRSRTEREKDDSSAHTRAGLLSLVGNEFAGPARRMLETIQLLLSTDLSDEQRSYVEGLGRSGATLLDTINDILDLSKIESGEIRLESIEFDLHTVAAEAVREFEQSASTEGLKITCLIHQEVPTRVKGDPGRLRNVLRRFLADATRSSSQPKFVLRVRKISGTPDAVDVRFEVTEAEKDSSSEGPKGEIGERSRPAPKRNVPPKSSGLGSEALNRIAPLMGGQFGMVNGPENRCTVWLSVRLAKPGENPPELPAARPNLRGLRVLAVVCQEKIQKNLLAFTLSWGMTCDIAPNAERALEILRAAASERRAYDLALIDTQIPGSNALELARALQGDPGLSGLRIIVLTALGVRGETEEFRRSGIAGYLSRPVNPSDLFNCLATVVSTAPLDGVERAAPQPLVTAHKLREAKASRNSHVLVVEDNTVNQMVAVRMLEKLGVRSDIAIDGKGAVEAYRRDRYDLILMDCAMPEMDGYAATKAIRELERDVCAAHTPIVAVTANARETDRDQCVAAGMDDYLAKPFTFLQFCRAVARWIPVEWVTESAPAGRATQEPSAIDASFLEDLRAHPGGGPTEFLTQLRAQFLREAADRLATINSAVAQGDALSLRAAAHSLKGSSGVMGAKTLATMCAVLEDRASAGRMSEAAELARHLSTELSHVREELDTRFAA